MSFHFLGKVLHGDQKAGGGVFGFLDKQLLPQSEQDKQNRNIGAKVVNRVEQSPVGKVDRGIVGAVKGMARGVAKVPETAIRSGAELAYNKVVAPAFDLPKQNLDTSVNDSFRKSLYGTDKLETYQSRGQGVHQAHPSVPGPLIAAGLAGLDFTPFGKGKTLSEQLIKATDVGAVKKLVPGIEDAKAAAIAGQKDPHIIENILSGTNRVPSAPPPIPAVKEPAKPTPIQENITKEVDKIKGDHNSYRADGQLRVDATKTIEGITAKGKKIDEAQAPAPEGQGITGELIPPPSKDPFEEINNAITGRPAAKGQAPVKGIASATREQAALLSKERGARFRNVEAARKDAVGEEAYINRRKALKGGYSKVDFNPMVGDVGETRVKQLFEGAQQKIYNTPDSVYEAANLHPEAARFNTEIAVRKVLGLEPGLPTRSELKLLALQSPKIAEEIKTSLPVHRKIFDAASVLFGSARTSKSTADLSMGGRQGLFVSGRNPVEWASANKESVKYAADKNYYNQSMKEIHGDEWGQFIDSYDKNVLTGGAGHEEAYAGSDILTGDTAKKLGYGHIVAGSERAYTGGLTKLRKDVLVKWFKAYGDTPEQAEAALGPKGVSGLIEVGRTLTGRGGKNGGWVAKNHEILSEALFSPKLWASRLEPLNPLFWNRIGPAGRKAAIENLGSFAAVAGGVLAAAVAAGATVEHDPRSSDFLKIKVGDTRYDILGGFQQNLVFGARQALGLSNTLAGTDYKTTKSSQTGALSKYGEGFGAPTQLSAAGDLLRNKANPLLASVGNIVEGKDKAGNKINPLTEIGQLFVPISVQGSYHGIQDEGLKGLAKNTPDLVGIGSQTYGIKNINITDSQKKYVDKLKASGASPEEIKADESFFQFLKVGAGAKQGVTADIDKALRANDRSKAQKLVDDYNKKLNQALKPWSQQYGSRSSHSYINDDLLKAYHSRQIGPNYIDTHLKNIAKGG